MLTQNAAWGNVEKALNNLRAAGRLALTKILHLELTELAQLIRPSGNHDPTTLARSPGGRAEARAIARCLCATGGYRGRGVVCREGEAQGPWPVRWAARAAVRSSESLISGKILGPPSPPRSTRSATVIRSLPPQVRCLATRPVGSRHKTTPSSPWRSANEKMGFAGCYAACQTAAR